MQERYFRSSPETKTAEKPGSMLQRAWGDVAQNKDSFLSRCKENKFAKAAILTLALLAAKEGSALAKEDLPKNREAGQVDVMDESIARTRENIKTITESVVGDPKSTKQEANYSGQDAGTEHRRVFGREGKKGAWWEVFVNKKLGAAIKKVSETKGDEQKTVYTFDLPEQAGGEPDGRIDAVVTVEGAVQPGHEGEEKILAQGFSTVDIDAVKSAAETSAKKKDKDDIDKRKAAIRLPDGRIVEIDHDTGESKIYDGEENLQLSGDLLFSEFLAENADEDEAVESAGEGDDPWTQADQLYHNGDWEELLSVLDKIERETGKITAKSQFMRGAANLEKASSLMEQENAENPLKPKMDSYEALKDAAEFLQYANINRGGYSSSDKIYVHAGRYYLGAVYFKMWKIADYLRYDQAANHREEAKAHLAGCIRYIRVAKRKNPAEQELKQLEALEQGALDMYKVLK